MKRSEINRVITDAISVLKENSFYLPPWAYWSPSDWSRMRKECMEIKRNCMGWDVTDFGKGNFSKEGLTLVTLRNGNPEYDNKPYCEKIMIVGEGQVTPLHFHWNKMEDIINRGGGDLCIRLWKADKEERMTDEDCIIRIDGVETVVKAGEKFVLKPGQSICFTPYIYHTFWAENGVCVAGEVSMVNDDSNDNRFYEPLGRYPEIEEDEEAIFLLCNEYPELT